MFSTQSKFSPSSERALVLAVSKGRILEQALPLLADAGIVPRIDPQKSRKLVFETSNEDIRLVVLRAQDVPTFVENGAAHLGITGKDVLLEHEGPGLYEPLDLGIAQCRLMVARPKDVATLGPASGRRPRVATKYVTTARKHFAAKGIQIDTIKLYGSMEIAPAMGLADWIVDLVESGATLEANGLEPYELVASISSRLVVNKVAMKMRHAQVRRFISLMQDAVAARALVDNGGLGR